MLQGLQAVISSGKAAALAPSSRVSVVQLIMADVVERLPREGLEQLPAVSGLAAMSEVGRQLCAGARSLSVQSHPTAQHEPSPLGSESDSDDASDVLGSISSVLTCGEGCTYQPRRSLAYEARLAGSHLPSALTLHPPGPPAARITAAPAVATLASICSSGSWAVDASSSSGAPVAAPPHSSWDVSSMPPQRQRARPWQAQQCVCSPRGPTAGLARVAACSCWQCWVLCCKPSHVCARQRLWRASSSTTVSSPAITTSCSSGLYRRPEQPDRRRAAAGAVRCAGARWLNECNTRVEPWTASGSSGLSSGVA